MFQLTTALPIPEEIIRVEPVLEVGFTGGVSEVVIPYVGWNGGGHWVVDVGAGTETMRMGDEILFHKGCKSPDVFPGIMSMCEVDPLEFLLCVTCVWTCKAACHFVWTCCILCCCMLHTTS